MIKKTLKKYFVYRLNVDGEWENLKVTEEEVEDVVIESLESGRILGIFVLRKYRDLAGKTSYLPLAFAHKDANLKDIIIDHVFYSLPLSEVTHPILYKLLRKQITRRTKIYSEARNLAFLLKSQIAPENKKDEE